MTRKTLLPIRVLFVLLIINLLAACGRGITGDPTATSNAPTLPPAQPTIVIIDGTPQVVYQEQFATPTLNLGQAYPVQLTELKFIQKDTQVTVLAKMRNTIADAIAKDVVFEIVARDQDGNRLHQDTRLAKYIFPNEITGMAYTFSLMPGFSVKNVELRVVSGVLDRNMKYQQPLSVRMSGFNKTETESQFTAWLDNDDPYTYTQVRLNAIAYNKFNEIIGGGTEIIDFVPHKDSIGVSVSAQSLLEPEVHRVEIYPWITQYSASLEAGKWWDTIQVKEWNFEVNNQLQVSGGAILKNLSKNVVVDTFYILTLSDEHGRVVKSDMGYVDYIWPEEELFFSPGAFDVPFTEIYPEVTSTPTGTDESLTPSATELTPSESPKPSKTPRPTVTPKPNRIVEPTETLDPSRTIDPSQTPDPSPSPQGRHIGVLARQLNQEPYPIEDPTNTPFPTKTPETVVPSNTPIDQVPTAEETRVEDGTETPVPTPDPLWPEPERVYPQTFVVDLLIVPGEFSTAPLSYNPLNASQTAFVDDTTAKVSVVNNLNIDLPNVVVYVLVYDADGQIVGGGKQISERILSSSATEVLIPLAYLGDKQNLTLKSYVGLTKNALTIP